MEETVGSENTANIFEYSYTEQQEERKRKTMKFQWITDIEHLNSRNTVAMKNHYLLTQIADIIMQLYLAWNPSV